MKSCPKLRPLLICALITVITVILFDVLAFVLPTHTVTRSFFFYKKDLNNPQFNRISPRGLFLSHPTRGMDLAPNLQNLKYSLTETAFEVQTNELGCFDGHKLSFLQKMKSFDYFAGDSFTFGHIPLNENFPSQYEKLTGKLALKCGVSHTGQKHQLSKFKEITAQLKKYPRNVFVGYFVNDAANDYAFPHSTIIEGFEVDTKGVNFRNELIEKNISSIQGQINKWKNDSITYHLNGWLRKYSLSFNLLEHFFIEKSFYRLQNSYNLKNNYLNNPLTLPNREILLKWKEDSRTHHYKLIVILIPDKANLSPTNPYQELEEYLQQQQISYVNIWSEFKKTGKDLSSFYLTNDAHLNSQGAGLIADVLAKSSF